MSALSSEKIDVVKLLKQGEEEGASHLYFKCGSPVLCRKNGEIAKLLLEEDEFPLSGEEVLYVIRSLIPPKEMELLEKNGQHKIYFAIPGVGRIQVAVYRELSTYTLSLKYLKFTNIPPELPGEFLQLAQKKHGLVLVTGSHREKNSLTLDGVIDYFDKHENKSVLILTNDEHVRLSKNSKFTSCRVIGSDFETYQSAVDFALEDRPDVLIIRELSDLRLVESVLHLAVSGTLVFASGYTQTAAETIVSYLDMGVSPTLLANSLAGIMSTSVVANLCDSCKKSRDTTAAEALLLGVKRKEHIVVCDPGSCEDCGSTGYSGEVVFSEVLEMSRALRKAIIYKQSVDEIEQEAERGGMRSIRSRILEFVKKQTISMRDV